MMPTAPVAKAGRDSPKLAMTQIVSAAKDGNDRPRGEVQKSAINCVTNAESQEVGCSI